MSFTEQDTLTLFQWREDWDAAEWIWGDLWLMPFRPVTHGNYYRKRYETSAEYLKKLTARTRMICRAAHRGFFNEQELFFKEQLILEKVFTFIISYLLNWMCLWWITSISFKNTLFSHFLVIPNGNIFRLDWSHLVLIWD